VHPPELEPEDYAIQGVGLIGPDVGNIVQEIQHAVNGAVVRAAQFIPTQLVVYKRLIRDLNEIVAQLTFLQNPKNEPPPILQDSAEALKSDPVARQKRINALTDYVVQINSALSYVLSQAYSCLSPILEGGCLYANYSLLGIGSAFCALDSFARFVERVFQRHPVYETVKDKYPWAAGVNVCRGFQEFEAEHGKWATRGGPLDELLGQAEGSEPKARLVFYSGRLGFQEAHFSVSAAMQALFFADTARWSLITLTHELMHSHVRDLLSAILAGANPLELSETRFQGYYLRYRQFLSKGFDHAEHKLQECLRFAIFNFCNFQTTLAGLADQTAKALAPPGTSAPKTVRAEHRCLHPEALWEDLRQYFKLANEIMVHVLDYLYFYDGKAQLFLDSVWKSWSTVPVVLVNVEHYLKRSLITVAITETGNSAERFDCAIRIVRESLAALSKAEPDNVLLARALETLNNSSAVTRLRCGFIPGFYLAQVTKSFLHSSHIHSALISDPNFDAAGGGHVFRIGPVEFPGQDITSPVALVMDRARRALLNEEAPDAVEGRAAWLFLACASAGGPTDV